MLKQRRYRDAKVMKDLNRHYEEARERMNTVQEPEDPDNGPKPPKLELPEGGAVEENDQ